MLFRSVRFKNTGKVYYFDPGQNQLEKGSLVVVETARGIECGEVVIPNKEVADSTIVKPLKPVLRPATPEDKRRAKENAEKEQRAMRVCLSPKGREICVQGRRCMHEMVQSMLEDFRPEEIRRFAGYLGRVEANLLRQETGHEADREQPASDWFQHQDQAAVEALGIFKPDGAVTYPQDLITREQVGALFARYDERRG